MNMSNQDLDWLAAEKPQGTEIDPAARERALAGLIQHTTTQTGRRDLVGGFRTKMFGFGAAAGIAAVAAAVVVTANGGSNPAGAGGISKSAQAPHTTVLPHHAGGSPLVRLADYVSQSVNPTGDATLVARTTTTTGGGSVTVYDLYADDGQYFFSPTEDGLATQVSAHHNLAGAVFSREIAAAKLAAAGNVETATQDMADAPDPSNVISRTQKINPAVAAAKQAATGEPQEGNLFDNWVWENSQDAIIAGSGDPEVRVGVLRILATLPGVTVTQSSSSGGQPTLVLSAGTPEMGYDLTEQLTINARTGVPIQFVSGEPNHQPAGAVNYAVSRVTLANLPSGAQTGN
jgi:hypothetical protein